MRFFFPNLYIALTCTVAAFVRAPILKNSLDIFYLRWYSIHNETMKKRVGIPMTAKRVRRVKADTDRVLKCISELGRLNCSRSSRELPIQSQGLIEPLKVCPVTGIWNWVETRSIALVPYGTGAFWFLGRKDEKEWADWLLRNWMNWNGVWQAACCSWASLLRHFTSSTRSKVTDWQGSERLRHKR